MGYDIGWAILGQEPLGRDELALLHAHVKSWEARIVDYDLSVATGAQPDMQAHCILRPSRHPDVDVDEDVYGSAAGGYAMDVVEEIFSALEQMREIVPRHEVVIQDDFYGHRWKGTGFGIAKDVSIDHPRWDAPGWIALGTLSLEQLTEMFADRPASPERPTKILPNPVDESLVPDVAKAIDDLIEIVLSERTEISVEDRRRYEITIESSSPSKYDVRDAVANCLARRWPTETANRLLDNADQWISKTPMSDLCGIVFKAVEKSPELIQRVVELWWRTLEDVDKARYVSDYLRPFAPVLIESALEILRAPLPALDYDTSAVALETLWFAKDRSADAVSILVACIRRDRRHPAWPERMRDRCLDALERLGNTRGSPSSIIELSEGAIRNRSAARLVAQDPERGPAVLARLLDCSGMSEPAVDFIDLFPDRELSEATRQALLEHPFWQVRICALKIAPYSIRDREAAAVWATFDGADVSVTENDRERFAGSMGQLDREGWQAEAIKRGFTKTLAPLPTAVQGMAARCADHRAWAIAHIDARCRIEDAAARVLADELDLALAAQRGHVRTMPKWSRWRAAIGDLFTDSPGRGAWARQHLDGVPAELRDVAERGAAAVAAEYPFGRLTLSPVERVALGRLEQDIASLGERLLGLSAHPS